MVRRGQWSRLSRACAVASITLVTLGGGPAAAQRNKELHQDGWILAAAHAPGREGAIWRTDLWVFYTYGQFEPRITFKFCKANPDTTNAQELTIPLDEQIVSHYPNVLDDVLSVGNGSWVGAIHYTATVPVQVWARIYSLSPDGRKSYGQLVNGIPTADITPDSNPWDSAEQQWLCPIQHTADGRFRVNVGVVNPTAFTATDDLTMFRQNPDDPTGQYTLEVSVPSFSMTQLNDPFAGADGGEWTSDFIRVTCPTQGAGGFAYASVVDNATNNAYFVRGTKRKGP